MKIFATNYTNEHELVYNFNQNKLYIEEVESFFATNYTNEHELAYSLFNFEECVTVN